MVKSLEDAGLYVFFSAFSSPEKVVFYVERARWPGVILCPSCSGSDVRENKNHRPLKWHCRDCNRSFSVRTGSFLQASKLDLLQWLLAIYLLGKKPDMTLNELCWALDTSLKTASLLRRALDNVDFKDRVFLSRLEQFFYN